MTELVDMRVIGLLCSYLCHELVNPLSAVNNGIELLMDVGDDMRDDALTLVESSAARTTNRVQFYRMAYGVAGESGLPELAMVRDLSEKVLAEGRISMDWPDADSNPPLQPGWGRILLNVAAVASGTLPRGGVLTVRVDDSGGAARLTVTARGEPARIEESARAALADDCSVDSLTPRTIQGYYTARLIADFGSRLEITEKDESEVEFLISVG